MKALRYAVSIAIPLLVISSILDLMLWFTKRFYVPSWTVSILGLCCAVLCGAVYLQLCESSGEEARSPLDTVAGMDS